MGGGWTPAGVRQSGRFASERAAKQAALLVPVALHG
jgi:hypothetical protein